MNTEIIQKMKLIHRILSDELEWDEIDSVLEWFSKEPEWEDIYQTERLLQHIRKENSTSL